MSENVDAGDFGAWLDGILASFKTGAAMNVPCGECRGCCSAGRFVHVLPDDDQSVIPKKFLSPTPGMPAGYAVIGYLESGSCPMLQSGKCSVYASRPSTCRTYDCRVLAAAGISAAGKWSGRINERVRAWQFTFSSAEAQQRYKAIRKAAAFIQAHGAAFPGGRVPVDPSSIAVLAIKVHSVFLSAEADSSPHSIAQAIVAESRRFERAAHKS